MGLNDPQWGRKKNSSGPPDLDQLWRNFNKKLNSLFKRKGGGSGSGGGEGSGAPTPRQYGGGIGLLVGLLVVLWIASGFYIVNEGQRGIVLRFGKYVETTQAGLRWHFPYPMEVVETVNVSQVRTVEVGYRNNIRSKVLKESLMLTDDENIIDVQFAVQYILKSPEDFLFNTREPEHSVMQVAEAAIREAIGKSKMDFVLYEGREQVAARATQLMQDILDRYKIGIAISKVTMQNAQPPEQVQAAFDDAVKAGQDRERQKNEGQAYANDIIPKARGAASRLLQEAEAYRSRVEETARGDASRFSQVVAEYQKAPAVTRDRMYIETMQEILSSTNKIMMDYRGSGNLLLLPLEKLLQQGGAATPSDAQASQRPAEAPAAEASPRSRESLRNRERVDR